MSSSDARLYAGTRKDGDDGDRFYYGDDEDDGAPIPDDDEEAVSAVEEVDQTEYMETDEANAGSNNASVAGGEEDEVIAIAAPSSEEDEDVQEDVEMKEEEDKEEEAARFMAQGVSTYPFSLSTASHSMLPMSRALLTLLQTSMHDNDLFEEHWELESRDASPVNDAEHDAAHASASTFAGDDEEEEEDTVYNPMAEGVSTYRFP